MNRSTTFPNNIQFVVAFIIKLFVIALRLHSFTFLYIFQISIKIKLHGRNEGNVYSILFAETQNGAKKNKRKSPHMDFSSI